MYFDQLDTRSFRGSSCQPCTVAVLILMKFTYHEAQYVSLSSDRTVLFVKLPIYKLVLNLNTYHFEFYSIISNRGGLPAVVTQSRTNDKFLSFERHSSLRIIYIILLHRFSLHSKVNILVRNPKIPRLLVVVT